MNEQAVKKQLDNMVSFIKKEADEKANEIALKADEEFTIEKTRLVQAQKLKYMKEFERREKQVEIQKKIAYSNELNKSRLRVLKAREEGIRNLFEDAKKRLGELTRDKETYKNLLAKLIIQGLTKMNEPSVEVRVRPEDKELVESVLPTVAHSYKEGTGFDVKLSIDSRVTLPSGAEISTDPLKTCAGGVQLSARGGRILLNNTLDQRLEIAYDISLPEIRRLLFGTQKLG
eukprot:TRINITY_DN13676_c0_g1_i1.p1 TRINITY_DN13676_c0_g1~~TRINITY_DN13676_c0_g1_i1.p1  ORF type:complete len:231 (-),score=61.64 TRINITY_DN13676_c0_g1_i1:66-758(-)